GGRTASGPRLRDGGAGIRTGLGKPGLHPDRARAGGREPGAPSALRPDPTGGIHPRDAVGRRSEEGARPTAVHAGGGAGGPDLEQARPRERRRALPAGLAAAAVADRSARYGPGADLLEPRAAAGHLPRDGGGPGRGRDAPSQRRTAAALPRR